MKVKGYSVIPELGPQAYIGKKLLIDGRSHQIGRLLDIGDEKFVYELFGRNGKPVDLVFKIYRDTDGKAAAKDAYLSEIFADAKIKHHPHLISSVPGGYVAVQKRMDGITIKNPETGEPIAFTLKSKRRLRQTVLLKYTILGMFFHPLSLKLRRQERNQKKSI
jgi:hypothetical protein